MCRIQRSITGSTARAVFGFQDEDNLGKFAFPAVQIAPAFCTSFPHIFGARTNVPCLIPCGIDQVPTQDCVRAPSFSWLLFQCVRGKYTQPQGLL